MTTYMPYNAYRQRAVAKTALPRSVLRAAGVNTLRTDAYFLVSRSTRRPIEPILSYLTATFPASSTYSPRTYEAQVADLTDFLDFLDSRRLELTRVVESDISAYSVNMRTGVSALGSPYQKRTVERRLSSVRAFYAWLAKKGRIPRTLDLQNVTFQRGTDPDDVSSIETRGSEDLDEDPAMEVRTIDIDHLTAIIAAMGKSPTLTAQTTPDALLSTDEYTRDRLMAEFGLQAGLRRAEVANLQVERVMALAERVTRAYDHYPLRVFGKGAKWRTVMTPGWLILLAANYARRRRAPLYEKRIELLGSAARHPYLFVRESGNPAQKGAAIAPASVGTCFRRIVVALKLTRRRAFSPTASAATSGLVPMYTFHQLRHTYAVHTYFVRKTQGDSEPWLYIKDQLGHEHVETTLRIYLKIVRAVEPHAAALLGSLLRTVVLGYAPQR